MEIRNLLTFQKIVEVGSFSKAADELGYTQSTVTMQMKQLESELQTKLFDRIGKTIQVNNNGLHFLTYANNIILESDHALLAFQGKQEPSGIIQIGILESICTAYLPQILSSYHMQYPKVTTVIKIGTYSELSNLLLSGSLDLLWIYDTIIKVPQFHCACSFESPIAVVSSPANALAQKSNLSLNNLSEESFILTEKTCSYRNQFTNTLSSLGIIPKIFIEIGNTEIIKKFVSENLGIAVLPTYTLLDEIKQKKLCVLPVSDYHNSMYGQLLVHKNKWISPALHAFIKHVDDYILKSHCKLL